jgi:hypothetical protein
VYPKETSLGTWLDVRTYKDERGVWLTVKGASGKALKLPRKSLERWTETPCRFLEGRTIASQLVAPAYPRVQPQVLVMLKADLEAIRAARRALPVDPGAGAEGTRRLTSLQIQEAYGVGDNFMHKWAARNSRNRPGKALRRERQLNVVCQKGSPSWHWVYREDDVLAILDGKESARPGAGSGLAAERMRKALHDRGAAFLLGVLAGGPLASNEVIAQGAAQGVSRGIIYQLKSKLKLEVTKPARGDSRFHLWRLPAKLAVAAINRRNEPVAGIPKQPQPATAKKAGRPRSADVEAVQAFCYHGYTSGKKLAVIQAQAATEFPGRGPKDEATVRLYARRYAASRRLPFSRPNS